jgi:ubiquinone/menaquinone biosynthesis C-methylase UbiE
MRDTQKEWEQLAEPWERARRNAWPRVAEFAETFRAGERILDLAGGNGRHGVLALKNGASVVDADFSRSLLHFAAERGLAVAQCDARDVPFRKHTFDGALFVAALHCIPTRPGRIGALTELRRVLKPGGRALVTVWSRFREQGFRGWNVPDADVPWGDVERYYHFYTPVELVADCRVAGWTDVKLRAEKLGGGAGWLPDNWFVTLRA